MSIQKDEQSSWAALLQPIKDLEKNWDIDIAAELTDYLEDLSTLTFEVDGLANLNFAEAAMVVHSSSCTYGKKVEYLMKLTMAALESAKTKHKENQGNTRRKQGNSDGHHGVLGLTSLLEDIVTGGCKNQSLDASALEQIQFPEQHPPLLLEMADSSLYRTVASEEAPKQPPNKTESTAAAMSPSDAPSFYVMRCHTHTSGALLLLASDGANYDARLHSTDCKLRRIASAAAARHAAAPPPTAHTGADLEAFGSPVMGCVDAGAAAALDAAPDDADMWYGDDVGDAYDEGGWDDGGAAEEPVRSVAAHAQAAASTPRASPLLPEEDIFDPYLPLNAHDASGAVRAPYKKLVPRAPKCASALRANNETAGGFRTDVKLPSWQPFLLPQASEQPKHLKPLLPSQKQRCAPAAVAQPFTSEDPMLGPAFQAADAAAGDTEHDMPRYGDDDGVGSDDRHLDFAFDDEPAGYDDGGEDEAPDWGDGGLFEPHDSAEEAPATLHGDAHASQSTALAYDDLVVQYSQAVSAAAAATDMQSSLSKKVATWQKAINKIMVEQDERIPFNVQETGLQLLQHAGTLVDDSETSLEFKQVVHCDSKFEVARSFSAFLQLVNNEKVDLLRGEKPADPFFVKVLDRQPMVH